MGVTKNETDNRFELLEDGYQAYAEFEREGDVIRFTHTVVPQEIEGRGVGSRLVRAALDDAKEKGLRVVPLCFFVRGFIERHPEYQDLVGAP